MNILPALDSIVGWILDVIVFLSTTTLFYLGSARITYIDIVLTFYLCRLAVKYIKSLGGKSTDKD